VTARAGHRTPWGSAAAAVRKALAVGVVEAAALAAITGLPVDAVNSALQDAAAKGAAVRLWRGVYARPDLAMAIRTLIAGWDLRPTLRGRPRAPDAGRLMWTIVLPAGASRGWLTGDHEP